MKTGLLEVVKRGVGKLECHVKWKSWCSNERSCEKDLNGKFIEGKMKSEMFGDTVRGGAVLRGDGKARSGPL